jgi:MFS family permease
MLPLYLAGFVTAFGAHAVAANLGRYAHGRHASLIELGVLLALYDGAEVILKPVFGVLADRIGPKAVLLGGLIGFAVASAGFVAAGEPDLLGLARFAQGAAAAAFSPAAGAMVAHLGGSRRGGAFGGYGGAKGLGYLAGPLAGGLLVTVGGYPLLFAFLASLATGVAVVVALRVDAVSPVPRSRETLIGLCRRLGQREFLGPVVVLGAATAALSAGVGFLPVAGARARLSPALTGGVVSLLAGAAALVQPRAGRAVDDGRLGLRTGAPSALAVAATGLAVASVFHAAPWLAVAALLIGTGVGVATPLGFAALAEAAPTGRMGQTMGAGEVGRELGDAGGPLLIGAFSTVSLGVGFGALAGAVALAGALAGLGGARRDHDQP